MGQAGGDGIGGEGPVAEGEGFRAAGGRVGGFVCGRRLGFVLSRGGDGGGGEEEGGESEAGELVHGVKRGWGTG